MVAYGCSNFAKLEQEKHRKMPECLDACNFTIATDRFMAGLWKPFKPHYNILTASSPREIGDCISIPKPVVATMSAWLGSTKDELVSPERQAAFDSIPCL